MYLLACGVLHTHCTSWTSLRRRSLKVKALTITNLHTYLCFRNVGQKRTLCSAGLLSGIPSLTVRLFQLTMIYLHGFLGLLLAIRSLALENASVSSTTGIVNPTFRTECADASNNSDFESDPHSYSSTYLTNDGCAHLTSDQNSNPTTSPPALSATAIIPETATATCPSNDPGALCGGSCCAVGQYCYAGETCMDASAGLPTPTLIAASSATDSHSPNGMNATTTSSTAGGTASISRLNSTNGSMSSSTAVAYAGAGARSFDATGLVALAWAFPFVYSVHSAL